MRNDILKAVALIAADPVANEHEIVGRLVAQGYNTLRAELLVAFIPLGLGRAVITRLPADPPVSLSATALIRDFTNDRTLEIRLEDVPEFVTAREMGDEAFLTGIIPREQFKAAVGFSVELNLVNDALNAGESISGAKASPPILLRLADAPGFEDWYQRVRPKKRRWRLW